MPTPRSTASRTLSLLMLPDEILEMIYKPLSNIDLKHVRLTSRHLATLVTLQLFHVFVLYPHQRSFRLLLAAIEAPHIVCHIRVLHYDASFAHVRTAADQQLTKICKAQGMELEEYADIIHPAWSIRCESLQTQDREEMAYMTQLALLSRAAACLTNLKRVKVSEGPGKSWNAPYSDNLPCFYVKLLEEAYMYAEPEVDIRDLGKFHEDYHASFYAYSIPILAAANLLPNPLEYCDVNVLDWTQFLENTQLSGVNSLLIEKTMRGLRELNFWYDHPSWGASSYSHGTLQDILVLAGKLESLTLRFRYNDMESWKEPLDLVFIVNMNRDCQRSFFHPVDHHAGFPARLAWSSQLRRLELGGLFCSLEEFKNVLAACTDILEDLTIRDPVLTLSIDPATRQPQRGCFVKLLKWMQQTLTLTRFVPAGLWSNGGMQTWVLDDSAAGRVNGTELSMHETVTKFVVKGGGCPLEHVEIPDGHYDLGKRIPTQDAPDDLRNKLYQGDRSWQMLYYDEDEQGKVRVELLLEPILRAHERPNSAQSSRSTGSADHSQTEGSTT
ncbi:hypothetical protein OHC33_009664 [Knufia fluminis]|uniref:F-box domain-containing protein n=1 Tax=Knufia fluminis TaxID=191047 RepID=A0AAN8I4M7_9EURO|nr:hypothetical protein OHC33_009664 [Knufia fluminis]